MGKRLIIRVARIVAEVVRCKLEDCEVNPK